MLRTKQTHIESIYKHKVKLMSVGCGCFVGRWNGESPLGGAQLAPLGHVLRLLLQGGAFREIVIETKQISPSF